ncbi:conserved transmembrane protein [Theileria orientalis]|uniref:Conserved transmembrane protein n=1 Tax=Theileria orientalis TaxID=68886 RepID=A0A976M9V0_THEOR|nr:conserved transmembrane protein [Theileria orientalis]
MASYIQDEAGTAGYYDPEKNEMGDHYRLSETTPMYVRHGFVRKVFFIVFLQLLFSFGFMLFSYFVTPVREFFIRVPYLGYAGAFVFFIASLVISCKPDLVRSKTSSTVALVLMTPCMALMLTTFCCHFQSIEIAIAAGVTTLVVGLLALLAFQTKYDFTSWLSYMIIVGVVFFVFVLISFFFMTKILYLVISAIGCVIVSFYILIDIQMIMGGKRKYQFTIDDYCLASIILYSDIISLFMDILRIVSASSSV